MSRMSAHQSSRSNGVDWLTPPGWIQALGPFDLDPCVSDRRTDVTPVNLIVTRLQNLTMLFHVVQSHDWPHTRSELYRKAVEVLLTEHNPEHQHKDAGVYSAQDLMLAAGAACAARLIADMSGISLTGTSVAGCPTYRDLAFVPAA